MFALELYGRLAVGDGNLFVSPYSISSALAMAYGGARGNTAKQMAAALHFAADQGRFHEAMQQISGQLAEISKRKNIELDVANGLWPQQNYGFEQDYWKLVGEKYKSELHFVDFNTDRERVAKEINSWIDQQTKHKIPQAVTPDMLTRNTRLLIVNALYFKGDWASCFEKGDTITKPFWTAPRESLDVPTMRQHQEFRFAEMPNLQMLELPYRGHELSMLIVLPMERGGLPEVEQQLNVLHLADWIKSLELRTVDVQLPKFSSKSRYSLKPALAAMGMTDAFSNERADFTGMTQRRPLSIGNVEHDATVEVDEQGTVAAAATSITLFSCSASRPPPPPATFHADRPFIFLIRDNHTGTILFMGRIMNPTQLWPHQR